MACLHVSNVVWCLNHTLKLVLKSELTEDKLYFLCLLSSANKTTYQRLQSFILCKMGSGSRYNKSRSRKRKGFAGNLGNSTDNNQQQAQLPISSLAKKIENFIGNRDFMWYCPWV